RLMTLIVLVVGAWLNFNGLLSSGGLVSFVLYVDVVSKPIGKISVLLELYPKGRAGFGRFRAVLAIDPDVGAEPDARVVGPLNGDITFEQVTFGYEKTQEPVLQSMSFNIRAGETVALVGPSGAGKTTISSLIPRFYDVDSGKITIDGIDIRDMTKRSLREQI